MHTLLLADDSLTVQRVIALTFGEEPIQVVTVGDGRQAMERMAAQRPDIVLAGTTLPHVNGYELAAFMRGNRELQRVPILLLSGAFEAVDDAKLASSGANGVIEKPVEPTVVISRVKQLLGLSKEESPATAGRLVTSADAGTRKLPVAPTPRAVTSTKGTPSKWEQLRDQTGLDANTRSVEDPSSRSDDYLGGLDDALDTLDRQISGRAPATRNPSGPLGQTGSTADPRSPGRRPAKDGGGGNPVFEVDDEWFGGTDSPVKADARASRQEIVEDLSQPEWQAPRAAKPDSIYEVDDEWFKDGEKARASEIVERKQLADEMGIHDVELPPREDAAKAPIDLDFGIEDFKQVAAPQPQAEAAAPTPAAPEVHTPPPAPVKAAPQPVPVQAPPAPPVAPPVPAAPVAPPTVVADDFAQLLAYEQGERQEPPQPPAPEIRIVAPEITPAMLDEIASRVADRLNAGAFGATLRESMTSAVRDTVRTVVSETSERLVREEIDRIKNKKA